MSLKFWSLCKLRMSGVYILESVCCIIFNVVVNNFVKNIGVEIVFRYNKVKSFLLCFFMCRVVVNGL